MSARETRINEAIVGIRMAQAVIEFAMESGKFESSIVLNDMQDQSDGLDHVAQLLMDIRDGRYTISQTHPFCFVTGEEADKDDDHDEDAS